MSAQETLALLQSLDSDSEKLTHMIEEHEERKLQREQQERQEQQLLSSMYKNVEEAQSKYIVQLAAGLYSLYKAAWAMVGNESPLQKSYSKSEIHLCSHNLLVPPLTAQELRDTYGDWLYRHRAASLSLSELQPDQSPMRIANSIVNDGDELIYFSITKYKTSSSTYFVAPIKRYARTMVGHVHGPERTMMNLVEASQDDNRLHSAKALMNMLQLVANGSGTTVAQLLIGTSYVLSQEIIRNTVFE